MPRNPTFSDKIAKIRQKSEILTRYKHWIVYYIPLYILAVIKLGHSALNVSN